MMALTAFLVPSFFNNRPTLVGFFLEWVPTTLQFATFLLLAMFYAYLVERNDWETKRYANFSSPVKRQEIETGK